MPTLIAALLAAIASAWSVLALWYRTPGGRAAKASASAAWLAFAAACLIGLWHGWFAASLLAFALAYAGLLKWWLGLSPSNDRAWADDVAQMVRGTVNGDRVTLQNVRNFAWRSQTDYTPRWESRSYDLALLSTLDMIVSYWSGRTIAHMLISFGFNDGTHVVFSVEIRREKTQSFSEIGGFFKEFELCVIAADERDIVRLRTNVRREDTYLFRLNLPVPAMRSLLLAYVDEANSLARFPRFYHTITGNCTTLVWRMLKRIVQPLPFSYRVLLSGYLPEYVYEVGALDRRYPIEELRRLGYISERARESDQSAEFSRDIRRDVPNL
ncbi:MAG: DUF4105 domain-containing protein [Steroidobacteraceae bacterium]